MDACLHRCKKFLSAINKFRSALQASLRPGQCLQLRHTVAHQLQYKPHSSPSCRFLCLSHKITAPQSAASKMWATVFFVDFGHVSSNHRLACLLPVEGDVAPAVPGSCKKKKSCCHQLKYRKLQRYPLSATPTVLHLNPILVAMPHTSCNSLWALSDDFSHKLQTTCWLLWPFLICSVGFNKAIFCISFLWILCVCVCDELQLCGFAVVPPLTPLAPPTTTTNTITTPSTELKQLPHCSASSCL